MIVVDIKVLALYKRRSAENTLDFLDQVLEKNTINKLINLADQQGELYDYISKSYELDKLYKDCRTSIFKNES